VFIPVDRQAQQVAQGRADGLTPGLGVQLVALTSKLLSMFDRDAWDNELNPATKLSPSSSHTVGLHEKR